MVALLNLPMMCLAEELPEQSDGRPASGYVNISHLKPGEMKERIICSVIAAVKYDVPANIILAVAEIEGGKPGQLRRKYERDIRCRYYAVQHGLPPRTGKIWDLSKRRGGPWLLFL